MASLPLFLQRWFVVVFGGLLLVGCGGSSSSGTDVSFSLAGDTVQVNEDTSPLVDVLANDTGTSLALQSVSAPGHGAAVIEGDRIRYTPTPNYYGSDAFTYTAADLAGETATAQVAVTVQNVNDPPTPQIDTAEVNEDASILINVLANDTDIDGDPLALNGFTQGSDGSVTQESGQLRYTPEADFSGADTFTYEVTDGSVVVSATVQIVVHPGNDPPVANSDTASLDEDSTGLFDVLANDTDPEGDTLSLVSIGTPTHGAAVIEGGQIRYTPTADYHGADTVIYTVSDGLETDSATLTLTVNPVNDAPVALADTADVAEGSTVLVHVLANDTDVDLDTLTITAVSTPAHGSAAVEAGRVRYTPGDFFNGSDNFTYTVSDGRGSSATATVTISVDAVNDPPVANNDSGTVDEDSTILMDVLANDTDVDGDSLAVAAVGTPSDGSAVMESGQVRYTPDADFFGTDSFTYTISDGEYSAEATVTVTVNSVNDPPVAGDDSAEVAEDSFVEIWVLSNDSDSDDGGTAISSATDGAHGTTEVSFDGVTITYTPAPNFSGTDTFTYEVSDFAGGNDTGTVTVTVTPVNDDPSATVDSTEVNESGYVDVNVLANDTDIDGDDLSITSVTQGTKGTVTFTTANVRYTPSVSLWVGQQTSDSFTYTVSDGQGGTATATVNVTVNGVNDPPVANNDTGSVNEDSTTLVDVLVNDTDPEGDTLSISAFTQANHGTVTQEGDSLRYTPDTDYNGTDSFQYTVMDRIPEFEVGLTDTAVVTITVNPVQDAPVAVNDSASVVSGQSVFIDILDNDYDVDGEELTLSVPAADEGWPLACGSVSYDGTGVRYFSWPGETCIDGFSYEISDGIFTVSGSVTVTVTAP